MTADPTSLTAREVAAWYDSIRTRLPVLALSLEFPYDAAHAQRLAEGHPCARCEQPAAVAIIGRHADDVNRWVDLCADCLIWVRSAGPTAD